jgi:hypothetical protein
MTLGDPALGTIRDHLRIEDDFYWYITAHGWTTVATDSGTIAHGDVANGVVQLLPSDGTVSNNDEAYLKSTCEVFKFATNRAIYGECRLQFTEGATDDVNVAFGFKDAWAANSIVDDGAGMATSFSGAIIYKVDGGTVWKCVTSNSTTQTISTSTTTAGGSSYQTLAIKCVEVDGTNMEVTFFVDGQPLMLAPVSGQSPRPIKHTVAIASATEMMVGAGIKNGADTTVEALNIDYIIATQTRV